MDKKVAVRFWKSSGPWVRLRIPHADSKSGRDSTWRRSALFECTEWPKNWHHCFVHL